MIELDLGARLAIVEPDDGETYTVARTSNSFRILSTDVERRLGRAALSLGSVEVASQVTGFQRFDARTRAAHGVTQLDLAASVLRTRAIWYTLEPDEVAAAGVERSALPGALHAVEHAAIGLLPLFAICDRWDVGGVSTAAQADTGLPTVSIHDAYPGGAGIAELAFDAADRHLAETKAHIAACLCASGCPSCVQSPKCGNGNEPLDKPGALALLEHICN